MLSGEEVHTLPYKQTSNNTCQIVNASFTIVNKTVSSRNVIIWK